MAPRPLPFARTGILCALAAWVAVSRHRPVQAPPSPVEPVLVAPAWAVDVASTPEGAAFLGRRLVLPSEPLKGQQRPPCPPAYDAINGGCWMKAEAKPRPACPDTLWEHDGGCYLPLLATIPRPSSLGR